MLVRALFVRLVKPLVRCNVACRELTSGVRMCVCECVTPARKHAMNTQISFEMDLSVGGGQQHIILCNHLHRKRCLEFDVRFVFPRICFQSGVFPHMRNTLPHTFVNSTLVWPHERSELWIAYQLDRTLGEWFGGCLVLKRKWGVFTPKRFPYQTDTIFVSYEQTHSMCSTI